MKVTIDSSEPLGDALRVVGALYDVELVVSADESPPADLPSEDAPAATRPRTRTSTRASTTAPPRRAGGRKRSAGAKPKAPVSNPELRSWARQNGFPVRDRGRVAGTVISAYRAAHDA